MKVTKLIIPLLGVSSITNANKQELLQFEEVKGLDVSYQVAVENEPNYFDITTVDTNITENSVKNELGSPRQALSPTQCWEIYQRALVGCAFLGPFAGPCIAAASAAYAACLAAAT